MGTYTTIKKYKTNYQDDECRIPGIEGTKFMSKVNFLRMCRGKFNPPKGNPFGKKKGVPDMECRGCPIGQKISAGENLLPINIIFLAAM